MLLLLFISVIFIFHLTYGINDMDQYNTFKYMTFGEPELSRCHWHCPFKATRLCACDPSQRLHRLFLNPCFMHLHNSCFGTEFMPLSGLSKCHEKYSYPERELEILKMTLEGLGQKIKQPLYGRVYTIEWTMMYSDTISKHGEATKFSTHVVMVRRVDSCLDHLKKKVNWRKPKSLHPKKLKQASVNQTLIKINHDKYISRNTKCVGDCIDVL